jgi:hypothetical protein
MENIYAEYGAIGVIVFLFIALIMNLIKSQKAQNEDETAVSNTMSICVKLVDRWNSSDQTRDRRHEDTIKELNDISDDLAYLKGRINGKGL